MTCLTCPFWGAGKACWHRGSRTLISAGLSRCCWNTHVSEHCDAWVCICVVWTLKCISHIKMTSTVISLIIIKYQANHTSLYACAFLASAFHQTFAPAHLFSWASSLFFSLVVSLPLFPLVPIWQRHKRSSKGGSSFLQHINQDSFWELSHPSLLHVPACFPILGKLPTWTHLVHKSVFNVHHSPLLIGRP